MKTITTLIALMVSTGLISLLTFTSASDEPVLVVHADTITDPVEATPVPTPIPTPEPTATPTPEVEVVNIDGDVFFVTPVVLDIVDDQGKKVDEVGVYLTTPASTVTISKEDNTNIILFPESVFSNSPDKEEAGIPVSTSHLINGKAFVSVPVACGQYRLETPLATIIIPITCTNKRNGGRSEFTADYSQEGLSGQLKVTANTGNIQVVDRNGVTTNLEAGQDHTIGSLVSRVTLVLPIDGDKIYGGQVNTLAWTEYEGAIGYVLEYNLPSPFFAEENAQSNEFPTLIKIFPKGSQELEDNPGSFSYVEPVDDVITMELTLGSGGGITVEARVFPIDANGTFLSGSESSDKITITWE